MALVPEQPKRRAVRSPPSGGRIAYLAELHHRTPGLTLDAGAAGNAQARNIAVPLRRVSTASNQIFLIVETALTSNRSRKSLNS
jgi:hypothetical protein